MIYGHDQLGTYYKKIAEDRERDQHEHDRGLDTFHADQKIKTACISDIIINRMPANFSMMGLMALMFLILSGTAQYTFTIYGSVTLILFVVLFITCNADLLALINRNFDVYGGKCMHQWRNRENHSKRGIVDDTYYALMNGVKLQISATQYRNMARGEYYYILHVARFGKDSYYFVKADKETENRRTGDTYPSSLVHINMQKSA